MKMKRLLGLLLASTLVLVACGNDENKEESKKEVKSKEKKIEKEKENKSKKTRKKKLQHNNNQIIKPLNNPNHKSNRFNNRNNSYHKIVFLSKMPKFNKTKSKKLI